MSYNFCPGKTQWPELLGVNAEVAARVIESENPAVRTVILHQRRHVRITDHSCYRVRIWVNENNIVQQVPRVA